MVGLLGAIFSYGVKKKLRADNPCHGVEKPKDVRRMRRLSDAEYAQFGAALDGSMISDIFQFLAVSGWRSSEAKDLQFSEVDLERRIANLGDTKSRNVELAHSAALQSRSSSASRSEGASSFRVSTRKARQ